MVGEDAIIHGMLTGISDLQYHLTSPYPPWLLWHLSPPNAATLRDPTAHNACLLDKDFCEHVD